MTGNDSTTMATASNKTASAQKSTITQKRFVNAKESAKNGLLLVPVHKHGDDLEMFTCQKCRRPFPLKLRSTEFPDDCKLCKGE